MANPNAKVRVATNGPNSNGPKVDPKDPQVRKLVYNMYRGMLDQKHQRANVILDSAPQGQVTTDEGVGARLESMMRQQNELKAGSMNAGGPPPPPPPPPIPGIVPSSRLPSEQIPARVPVMSPPAALASAMMKDKKPFTYTPGGLDLSEINAQSQPQQNGSNIDQTTSGFDVGPPIQSRSFRMLQNVLNHQDTAEPQGPVHIPNLRQQQKPQQQQPSHYQQPGHYQQRSPYQQPSQFQQPGQYQQPGGTINAAASEQAVPEPKKYMGGSIPSRSFRMLQAMTDADDAAGPGQSDL